jgi:nicotinamidase-related amidase
MATGLVVLDMLADFVDGKLANPAAQRTIDPIATLATRARERDDWWVIYGNDAHQPGDFELEVFGEHAMADTPGAEVIPSLTPRPGDIVVPKRSYSAFTQTDLDATCRTQGIDRLVLVGQHTECCCRHTAYDAFTRGLDVVVVSDATASFEPMAGDDYEQAQHSALNYLRTYYKADIMATDEVV